MKTKSMDFKGFQKSHHWNKGSSTINGEGSYECMFIAIDGQISSGGGTDKFRIKIWDKTTNTMVYDNILGAADDETPTIEI
jgi:hypothetical protein